MAIRIITIREPINVHELPAVDKKLGRPTLHPDRAVYKRNWMRRYRVELKADARLLAVVD
jgi:hypothetical protein